MKFGKEWKKIEEYMGTKTDVQIRTYALSHFLKSSQNEELLPSRRKNKLEHTYPYKNKHDISIPWVINSENITTPHPLISNPSAFTHWLSSNGLLHGAISSNSLELQRQQQEQLQQAQQYLQQAMSQLTAQNPRARDAQPLPNFVKIYGFLGSLFNPSATNYTEVLNEMTPIDCETIQLLMHNLAANLANQQFKEHHSMLLDHYRNALIEHQATANTEQSSDPFLNISSMQTKDTETSLPSSEEVLFHGSTQ